MQRSKHLQTLSLVAVTITVLAASANAAILWTPANTTTAGWYDAADAGTITHTGGAVSQWNDKSGNNRHATQATAASQPTTGLLSQNGLNVISFDGTDDFFDLGTGLDWMAGNDHIAFAVLLNTNYSNLYGAATAGAANNNRLHVGFRNNTSYRINIWANDSYPAISSNYNSGQYNFMRWTWDVGAPKTIHANGKSEGTNGNNALAIGTMSGGGRINNVVSNANQGILDMELAELVFLQGTSDQDTIDRMEGYLAWKWGLQANLPTGHAYELSAPEAIPEPSTLALAGLGLLGLIGFCRRKR